MRSFCVILFALGAVVSSVCSYRILGIFPHAAKSHYIVGDALMKGLAAKGHDVTMISPHKQSKPIKNYRSIHLEKSMVDSKQGIEKSIIVISKHLPFALQDMKLAIL